MMKSYEQACALALALDRIGDRWTLLILRELFVGPKRFNELRRGLPGIASNLLAERMKSLVEQGLVLKLAQEDGTVIYAPSEAGRGLEEVVNALIRWGGRWLPETPPGWQEKPEWLLVALPAVLRPADPTETLRCVAEVDGFVLTIYWQEGRVDVESGADEDPDVTLKATYRETLAFFSGYVHLERLLAEGATVEGGQKSVEDLSRLARPATSSRET